MKQFLSKLSFKNFLVLAAALFLVACSDTTVGETGNGNSPEQSGLPTSPEKVKIQWNEDGGMLNRAEYILISTDSCFWDFQRYGRNKQISFELSDQEIDELYAVFVENQFDKIECRKEDGVYDRGGVRIELKADEKYIDVDNTGGSFVNDKWRKNWINVSDAITSLTQNKLKEQEFKATVRLDESIDVSDYDVKLSVEEPIIYDSEKDGEGKRKFDFEVLEGPTYMDLYLFVKDSLNQYGGKVTYLNEMFFFDFTPQRNEATIYLEEGKLKVK